jgi:hypothetical protein
MNLIQSLLGLVVTLFLFTYIIGVAFAMIAGRGRMAKQFTDWYLKTSWKTTRRILKTLIGLAADFFKWLHSKV